MFSKFFIYRPIAASVISILIVMAGLVAYRLLPVSKYPEITPPVVRVSTTYPGADASVLADTVAAPIEQQVNGVSGMLYMNGICNNDGSYTLDVTFALGTDVDIATVLVQNRVAIATPRLPSEVQRQGITTQKQSTVMVGVYGLYAPGEKDKAPEERTYTDLVLSNYITQSINDEVKRINGVGDTKIMPAKDYSMRVWLDPEKMKARKLNPDEVVSAIQGQNVQVPAGQIGQPPVNNPQDFQLTITTLGRLKDVKQFEDIIIKSGRGSDSGSTGLTYLKDVARVELGGKSYDTFANVNGVPGAIMIVYLTPGGNAVETANKVKAKLAELEKDFPPGVKVEEIYNVSRFVTASIEEVNKTLYEAVILVVIVVLVFLQNWRSTLIPIITIPVALIGTFAVLFVLGFSVNMLTLFGIVLAIGIVVDDAIVVVENVERNMHELHLPPREATVKAMEEVGGAIIAISLVLMSVFLPSALLPGITGQLYKQFAVTIAVSTLFSALNALTLSPALTGVLLKSHADEAASRQRLAGRLWANTIGLVTGAFCAGFNKVFDAMTAAYARLVALMVSKPVIGFSLLAFGVVMYLVYRTATAVPGGFLPNEDQGLVIVSIQLPDGASQDRTREVVRRVGEILNATKGVSATTEIGGFSSIYNTNASNYGTVFAALEPWEEREHTGRQLPVILGELRQEFAKIQEAMVFAFILPPVDGLGNASGFEMKVENRAGTDYPMIQAVADDVVQAANAQSKLRSVGTSFRASNPQLFAETDREKVSSLNMPLSTVNGGLGAYLGSAYVNDFNLNGRTYQVTVQAESKFRNQVEDVGRLEVRNNDGQMLPLSSVLRMNDAFGPNQVVRYNLYPCASVIGEPALGVSTGEALDLMEQIAKDKLPPGMGFDWTSIAYQEKTAGGNAALTFAMALAVVYLLLAFQYESWTTPAAVILSIPLAVLGSMVALMMRGSDNNVFTQIGLVLLVGLAAKNAILIVEFAREKVAGGMGHREAAVEAARLRLRPILMTSFAFILGVYPLVIATGAGAASRQAIGTAVFSGMISNTILGLLFTPVLYVAVQSLTELIGGKKKDAAEKTTAHEAPEHDKKP
jgi:HAE1 family hydrophobic/amphiphilic exporter-1